MKKSIIVLTALTLALTLAGCSESDTQNAYSAAETTVSVTETETTDITMETTAETVTETSAATSAETTADVTDETTEAAAETTAENGDQVTPITDEAQLIALTKELLQEYQLIDGVCAFGLNTDPDDTYQPEGSDSLYQHVTDSNYASVDDLKRYFGKTLTGDEKSKIEKSVFECEVPIYIEHDGKLYMLNGGRGSNMNFQLDTIKVSDVTNDGYKALVKKEDIGGDVLELTVTVVRIDGEYLISSIA